MAVRDVQARLRRAAPGVRRVGRLRTATSRSRSRRALAHDTERHARAGAPVLGARRPPEPDDQDPRHRRGPPGDRGGALRGHQRQRHAAVRGLRLRAASWRRSSRAIERRHAEGKSLDVHSVASFFVSRVDSEVDKRLEELGRDDLAGRAGLANARAAYQAFQRVFEGERFAALREAGARSSARCGPRPASRTRSTPRRSTSTGSSRPHTVNTMPLPTLLAARAAGEVTGATAADRPAGATSTRSPRPASTSTTSPTSCSRRHRGLRDVR